MSAGRAGREACHARGCYVLRCGGGSPDPVGRIKGWRGSVSQPAGGWWGGKRLTPAAFLLSHPPPFPAGCMPAVPSLPAHSPIGGLELSNPRAAHTQPHPHTAHPHTASPTHAMLRRRTTATRPPSRTCPHPLRCPSWRAATLWAHPSELRGLRGTVCAGEVVCVCV